MKNIKSNSAVIYCRVSSKEQEETGYSLPAQEKLLNDYSERKGFKIIKIFSVAESASGSKQRKVFSDMMSYISKNGIANLVVEKVDRLTRNLKEAVVANDWIDEDENRYIHFVKQNLVLNKDSKSDEKFRWDIEIVLAKKYISNLSEEVRKGQAEKISQGGLPSRPPYGYQTIGESGRKVHIIDPERAPLVRKLFDLYSTGNYSMKAVLEKLYEEGMRTDRGKKFVKSMIESILNNPFYYGSIKWKDVIYSGAHEPIITKEVFDIVKDIRNGKKAPSRTKHNFMFRKLIKCGECGGTITAELQKGTVYYHCSHYNDCKQKLYTREDKIEEALVGVFRFFENLTVDEAGIIKDKIRENHSQEIEYKEKLLRSLEERYRALQRRLDALYDDRLDGAITQDFWKIKNTEIINEQEEVVKQMNRAKDSEAKYFEYWLNILDLASRASEIYNKRNKEGKRMLLNFIFSNLILKDGKLTYKLNQPMEILSKRIQEKIDYENSFEPNKNVKNKRRKGSLEPICPALLPG